MKNRLLGERGNTFRSWFERSSPFLMLLPAALGVLCIQVYPTIRSIVMSFFDISLLNKEQPFIGLDNYIKLLRDPVMWKVMLNTILFALLSLAIGGCFAMLVAVELNKNFPGKGLFRTIFLVPWVTPPLVTSMIWKILVSESFSPINAVLLKWGLIDHPLNFLGQTDTIGGIFSVPMLVIIIINVWSIFPFMMVMFLAGLQTIPAELYEAAEMDGAKKFQQFFYITLPSLMPVISTSILLQGIWQFNSFNVSYMVTKGGPLHLTEVMAVRVYSEAFINFRYGLAAATSVIMLLLVLIPSVFYLRSNLKAKD